MYVTYSDAINAAAAGAWGKEFKDEEAAVKELLSADKSLADVAMLDILRRFAEAAKAFTDFGRPFIHPGRVAPNECPETAAVIPGAKVGGVLYDADDLAGSGIGQYVVFHVDEAGHCQVVEMGFSALQSEWVQWAHGGMFLNLREAVVAEVKESLNYHVPVVEWLHRVLKACESDKTDAELLEAFQNGMGDD